MKREGKEIICPSCKNAQQLDVFDLTEPGETKGSMRLTCIYCDEKFRVSYELKPFVSEEVIEE